ncbi:hypothetical protein Deipe_1655 [Deinococcus peraridilitoris DSM 19664]|uniref:Lipoprotein n=1 Tax=Deinococcus peraridilitoris (strain DSM 19664 / LMG 22246 / CIP 109416 / KR-200) TaxID=937777 RepID=K9ZZY2_DEIPD|nr:hypothetical protein Deipe_1655 [Deinococcus peraridilitoris DSM 19664]
MKCSSLVLSGLLLTLSACSSTPTGSVTTNDTALTLSGRVVNWPGGPATLELRTSTAVLARGTVSETGDVNLVLPDASTMSSTLMQVDPSTFGNCTSTLVYSDLQARWRNFKGVGVYRNGTSLGSVGRGYGLTRFDQAKPGDYLVRWMYVDRPLNVVGTYSCAGHKETVDLRFKPGWNAYLQEYTTNYSASGGYYEIRTHSGSDATARWGFQSAQGAGQ